MPSGVAHTATLADQKLAEEVNRLRLENEQQRRPVWRSTSFMLSLAGLLLSLVGNLLQYDSAKAAGAHAAGQLRIAESRWTAEREKLNADLDAVRQKNKSTLEDRLSIQAELNKWVAQIADYREQISDTKTMLRSFEAV